MSKILTTIIILGLSLFADTAKVEKVSDGDTIHAGGKTIRILYIDTPEKFESDKLTKNASENHYNATKEQKLGELASAYAHQVLNNKVITYEEKKSDKYGRALATIKVDGIDYSARIIADGYACIYRKADYPFEYEALLANAKLKKLGLWKVDYETMNKLCR